jgi:hypothetical protein
MNNLRDLKERVIQIKSETSLLGTKEIYEALLIERFYRTLKKDSGSPLLIDEIRCLCHRLVEWADWFFEALHASKAIEGGGFFDLECKLTIRFPHQTKREGDHRDDQLWSIDCEPILSQLTSLPITLESIAPLIKEHIVFECDGECFGLHSAVEKLSRELLVPIDPQAYPPDYTVYLKEGERFQDALLLKHTDRLQQAESEFNTFFKMSFDLDLIHQNSFMTCEISRLYQRAERDKSLKHLCIKREIGIASVRSLGAQISDPEERVNDAIKSLHDRLHSLYLLLSCISKESKWYSEMNDKIRLVLYQLTCITENKKFLKNFFDS